MYFFHCYINVLPLNTIPLIYILCIKWGKAGESVTAVRDVELTVRGDELMSSEVAEGRGTRGKTIAASRIRVSE